MLSYYYKGTIKIEKNLFKIYIYIYIYIYIHLKSHIWDIILIKKF